jgi:hypothetical protein
MNIKTLKSKIETFSNIYQLSVLGDRMQHSFSLKKIMLFAIINTAIFFQSKAVTILQGDTIWVCALNFPYTLTATSGLSQYQWNTGSTSETTVINGAGKYWLSTNENGLTTSDTITVEVKVLATEIFETDKSWHCIADTPWLISSNEIFEPAGIWNTSATGNVLQTSNSGKYWYEFIDSTFCIKQIDTTEVMGVSDSTVLHFSNSIDLCATSFPHEIYVQLGDNPLWHNSTTDFVFYADSAGIYSYTSYLSNCAVIYDTLKIDNKELNAPVLCCDTITCLPDSIALSLPEGFVDYYWSTGQNAPSIFIAKEGVFNVSVRVTDSSNCSAITNTILVELKDSIPTPSIVQNGAFLVAQPAGFTYQWYRNDTLQQGQTASGIRNEVSGIYCVKVSQGICFDSACYTYINPLGILNIKDKELKIHPNPVENEIMIESSIALKEIIIYNTQSVAIFKTTGAQTINASSLPAGVYFLLCTNAEGQKVSRMFLKK